MNGKLIVFVLVIFFIFCGFMSAGHAAEDKKLDLNKATVEELAKVPGMNREIAEMIVETRKENGDFVDMEELLDIDGIDNKLLRTLKQYIFIDDVAGCNC